jgi:hypothetical protein
VIKKLNGFCVERKVPKMLIEEEMDGVLIEFQ